MTKTLTTVATAIVLSVAFSGTGPVVWFDMETTNAQGQVVNLGSAGAAANLTFAQYGCTLTNESAQGQALFSRGDLNDGARFSCPDMTDRTISFWIRRDVDTGPYTESSYPNFISGGPGNGMRVIFGKTSTHMTVYLANDVLFNVNLNVLDRHVWEHLALTFANTESGSVDLKVYLNGTQLYAVNAFVLSDATVVGGNGARQMCIGGNGNNRPICCCADEFRIWNRALSADEVRAEYARIDRSLIARWRMDAIETDGEDRYVRDSSGWGTDLKVGPGVTMVDDVERGPVVRTDGTTATYSSAVVPARFADYTLTAFVKQSSDSIYNPNAGPRFLLCCGDYLIFSPAFNYGTAVWNADSSIYALITKDGWSHFALRVKNNWDAARGVFVRTATFFLNGVQKDERVHDAATINWQAIGSNVYLFNLSPTSNRDRPFEGGSADVRLYAGALDDAKIREIARGPAAVAAGGDFSVAAAEAVLRGTVAPHGDEWYVDGFAGNVRWETVSTPQGGEGAAINTPESAVTKVTLPVEGAYRFRLVSEAGGRVNAGTVTVTRVAAAAAAPSVSVVASASVVRPLRLHIAGPATGAERVRWRKVSGPGGVWFEPADAAETDISFSGAGSYVLRLTAENGGASASADVTVNVTDSTGTVALDDGLKIHWPMDDDNASLERVTGDRNSVRPDFTNTFFTVGARLYGVSAVSNNSYVIGARKLRDFEKTASGNYGTGDFATDKWVSVSMWIYRDSRITHEVCVPYVLSSHQSLGIRYGRLDNGADGFTVQQQGSSGGTGNLLFNPPARSTVDRWTHLYALYDRVGGVVDNFAFYVDGVKQTPVANNGFPRPARIMDTYFEIGGISPGRQVGPAMGNVKKGNDGDYYSATFPGAVDDIRIYDRPLTEAEIRTLASRPNLSENLPPVFSVDAPMTLRPVARRTFALPMAAFDDGLPAGGALDCEWRVVSENASNVTFTDATVPGTDVRFAKSGTYTLQLVAADGERTSYSPPVTVDVQPLGTTVSFR